MNLQDVKKVKSFISLETLKAIKENDFTQSKIITTFLRYTSLYCKQYKYNESIFYLFLIKYFKKHLSKDKKRSIENNLIKDTSYVNSIDTKSIEIAKKQKKTTSKIKINKSKLKKDSHYYKGLNYAIAIVLNLEVANLLKEYFYKSKHNYYISYAGFKSYNEIKEVVNQIKEITIKNKQKLYFKTYILKLNNTKIKFSKVTSTKQDLKDNYNAFINFHKLELQKIIQDNFNIISNEMNYINLECRIKNILNNLTMQDKNKNEFEVSNSIEIFEHITDKIKDYFVNNKLKSLQSKYLIQIVRNEYIRYKINEKKYVRYLQTDFDFDINNNENLNSMLDTLNSKNNEYVRYNSIDFNIDIKFFFKELKKLHTYLKDTFSKDTNYNTLKEITFLRLHKNSMNNINEMICRKFNILDIKQKETFLKTLYKVVSNYEVLLSDFINDSNFNTIEFISLLTTKLLNYGIKKRKYHKQPIYNIA